MLYRELYVLRVRENCSNLTVEYDEKNYSLNQFRLLLLSNDIFSEKITFLLPDAPTMEPAKSLICS